ncbi:hypothetical protein BGP84_01175 [Pseudomonas putida]|uniref:DUF1311 domain-containing protein n=1 Tax=Pseudomonas putida TaxID=303 RepID=A0A2S3X8I7_PSEPU|nr:hypothetical protein [Pseudomonas putida]POG01256.1 hypothetical protein BGP85_22425 [Pseudomonas putida]POG11920.1 hypothetical protein BGP84_01175 [Pseudomonas putida]
MLAILKRRTFATLSCAVLWSTFSYAEPSFHDWLTGTAAMCSIDSHSAFTDMLLAKREHGEKSKSFTRQVEKSYAAAQKCVDEVKPKGKQRLKDAVALMPSDKREFQDSYSAWLGYLDWLSTPRESGESSPEQIRFQQSMNDLQAAMDAR